MMRYILLCVLLLAVGPLAAQEGPDPDETLLALAAAAYEDLNTRGGYSVQADVVITQALQIPAMFSMDGALMQFQQQFIQDISGRVRSDTPAVEMRVVQTATGRINGEFFDTIDMTVDLVRVEDEALIRISDVTPPNMAALYPQGWMPLDEMLQEVPGMAGFDGVSFNQLLAFGGGLALNTESVRSVYELTAEIVDGQTLRRLVLLMNAGVVFDDSGMVDALAAGMMAQGFAEMEDATLLLERMAENMQIKLYLWVGVDDGLLHRSDTLMHFTASLDGLMDLPDGVWLEQYVSSSSHYSDRDADFSITLPLP